MVTGLTTIPASNFFTLRTSSAWSAMGMLRWITPIPPAWAIAIASALSVTVSIAAEISGMPSSISRVSRVAVSVSAGKMPDAAGTSITSSKVSACRISIGASFPMAAQYTPGRPAEKLDAEMPPLSATAIPGGNDIGLGRFGPARRRLGMAQFDEVPLQRGEQLSLGAALKHLGDKGPAGLENF